jgi:hypothetical protein
MAKVFQNGKWVEGEAKAYSPVPAASAAKVFKDGKWTGGPAAAEVAAPAPSNPRDTEPLPPKPPATDADRPRWIADNVKYLEALGEHRNHIAFKSEHPELKGKGWNP